MVAHDSNGHALDENGARKLGVMLADGDQAFLQVLVASLQTDHRDQLDIVGAVRSSEECVLQAQVLAPEVVLMDLNMPGPGALWAIRLLHILFPETRVIVLALNAGAESRRAILAAGGTGVVSKTAWKTDLIPAIQRAIKADDMDQSIAWA